jgi:hypothetical protein
MPDSLALAKVKAMIDQLDRAGRAFLRPWLLAHFDENGDELRGYVERPKP